MMKIPKPSWDSTFTFLMARAMIVILCNIVYSCIRTICWQVGSSQISTRYGLMVIVCNSKVKYLGTLSVDTLILLVGAFVRGFSLALAIEKVCTMELM